MSQYFRVDFRRMNGKRVKVLLKDINMSEGWITGIEVNEEGDEVKPKGQATERLRMIQKALVIMVRELEVDKTYGIFRFKAEVPIDSEMRLHKGL